MLQNVKWGEFKVSELFEVRSTKKKFDANKVTVSNNGVYPYVVRVSTDNGQKGYINEDPAYLNDGNTISFGQDTATVFYQESRYFTGDKIKILKPKNKRFSKHNAQFFVGALTKGFSSFSWGSTSFSEKVIRNQIIKLPIKNEEVDFDFIEDFINQIEKERLESLSNYLSINGLNSYKLSKEESLVLNNLNSNNVNWGLYNLKDLFGSATRGKRLKSADRIKGNLPFVTAGEKDEGVSDFIGNNVHVFSANTTTIDMFGSAKYRNYQYGGDDHIAVVHTEKLPKYAAIFITTAIHNASNTGKFDYGKNFYAKDADGLNIMLPSKDGKPDIKLMSTIVAATHKLVVKNLIQHTENKLGV